MSTDNHHATDLVAPPIAGLDPAQPLGSFDAYFDWQTEQNPKGDGHITKIKTGLAGRRKVALVGFSAPAKVGCPFDNEEWEIWSLNQHYRHQPRASRWFEIHTRKQYLSDVVPGTDYLAWLQVCPLPLYVNELHPDLRNAILVPAEAVKDMGAHVWEERQPGQFERRDYTQSSLAVMFMVALLEGFDTIGIWGVDLIVGTEYFYQKANLEWLLGFAQGRGYTVTRGTPRGVPREIVIPETSALLRQTYSYGPQTKDTNPLRPLMLDRQQAIVNGKDELVTSLNKIDGELWANKQWMDFIELHQRGEAVSWTHADEHVEVIPPGDVMVLLKYMKLRQEYAQKEKESRFKILTEAEGELKDVTNWLTLMEAYERGAAVTWRFVDGRTERINPVG